jgi:hypothetical protein
VSVRRHFRSGYSILGTKLFVSSLPITPIFISYDMLPGLLLLRFVLQIVADQVGDAAGDGPADFFAYMGEPA